MHQMRQSGATLEQVGSRFGISRERVRQLLTANYGSTRVQELLTATELARLAGCTWKYIDKLRQRGVIQPAKVIGHRTTLWKAESAATVIEYIDNHRCPVCNKTVPTNREVYCSKECYLEARRYKNMPEEKKRRHNELMKRWRDEHPEEARQILQRAHARERTERAGNFRRGGKLR